MKQVLILISLILAIVSAYSQPYDSIGLHKVKLQAGKFTLNQFGISKIKMDTKGPVPVTDDGIGTGEKVVEGLFTMFTGWTTSSSSESLWQLNNSVKLGGIKKEIAFPVQVTGFYEKTRERVRDENGSSLETFETYNLYWEEGAKGSIIEEEDTLGTFALKPMNTLRDSIDYWKSYTSHIPMWLEEKLEYYRNYDRVIDFVVAITLQDQSYILVYNAENFQCALIYHHEMVGLWQHAPSRGLFASTKKSINPYMLLPSGLSDDQAQKTLSLLILGLSLANSM